MVHRALIKPHRCFSFVFSCVSIQRTNGTGKGGMEQDAQGGRDPWSPSPRAPHHQQPQRQLGDSRENTNKIKLCGIPTEDFPRPPCFRTPQKVCAPSEALLLLQAGPSAGLEQRGEELRPGSSVCLEHDRDVPKQCHPPCAQGPPLGPPRRVPHQPERC